MVIFDPPISGASTRSVSAAQLQRFARRAQKLARVQGEVDILIASNKRLRDLNRRFRRKNKPTDVLSFPRPSGGDIAISAQIALENAQRYGHSLAAELKILVLHGMLHLAGYDHESDNGRMARAESRLRSQLKLPASLIDRTHSSGKLRQSKLTAARSAKAAKTIRKPTAAKRKSSRKPQPAQQEQAMTLVALYTVILLLCALLVLVSYVERLYTESGKFLSREFQENIEAFENLVEPRLLRSSQRAALTFSVLTQLSTASVAFIIGYLVFREPLDLAGNHSGHHRHHSGHYCLQPAVVLHAVHADARRMAGEIHSAFADPDLSHAAHHQSPSASGSPLPRWLSRMSRKSLSILQKPWTH